MSEILLAGLLVSVGLFVTGLVVLPGVTVSARDSWPGGKLARSSFRQAASAAVRLGGRHSEVGNLAPSDLVPLQMASGALGLVGGLALSVVLVFPSIGWLLTLLLGASCCQLPELLLRQRLAARKRAVHRELPEVVGLLRAFPGRNLAISLAAITRTSRGPLAAAIRAGLERNATGVPLLKALEEATASLQVDEVERFVEVLSQSQATSARSGELLHAYEQELLSRHREAALRRVETAEGKISAVLTVATAMQLLLLLVVPSLLQFLGPGSG